MAGLAIRSDAAAIDLNQLGASRIEQMDVEVIDSVADYAEKMAELFDFDAIKKLFGGGDAPAWRVDAAHARPR